MGNGLFLLNGTVRALDGTVAEGVACREGRVVALGRSEELRALVQAGDEVVDLSGRLVLPAFSDAHCHFAAFALSRREVDLRGVTSLAEAVRRVGAVAAQGRGWITGRGWLHDAWGGQQPTRQLLDQVVPNRPVALWRNDHHAVWVNSLALALAGITATTPDPPGGVILREANGEPSGVLLERAAELVRRRIPPPSVAELAEAIVQAAPLAHREGIAAVYCPEGLAAYQAYRLLHQQGRLPLRVGMCLATDDFEAERALLAAEGQGDAWLHWTHLKLYADGALGPRTAWMLEPYDDDQANTGVVVTPPEELGAWIRRAAAHGVGCAIHAIGDAANRAALDQLAATRAHWAPAGLRPRIEHAQCLHPADIPRFAALGVVASLQPIHALQDMPVAVRAWGKRVLTAYPLRSLLESGARLAFGSDAPVETLSVLAGLRAACLPPEEGTVASAWQAAQTVPLAAAVAAYTRGAAWAEGREHERGTLTPGALADLVVLDRDLLALPIEALREVQVVGTVIGGQWVYRNFPA
ncbi:MAG: amidohydrolase [Dehalococcoidia bacterium]|nr:MAG: amidohydrolase [Dehalococcoidia bacterium]